MTINRFDQAVVRPLFNGFMSATAGGYIIQAWRLFDSRIRHHPEMVPSFTALVAAAPRVAPVPVDATIAATRHRCRARR
jgi:hypothetical protein